MATSKKRKNSSTAKRLPGKARTAATRPAKIDNQARWRELLTELGERSKGHVDLYGWQIRVAGLIGDDGERARLLALEHLGSGDVEAAAIDDGDVRALEGFLAGVRYAAPIDLDRYFHRPLRGRLADVAAEYAMEGNRAHDERLIATAQILAAAWAALGRTDDKSTDKLKQWARAGHTYEAALPSEAERLSVRRNPLAGMDQKPAMDALWRDAEQITFKTTSTQAGGWLYLVVCSRFPAVRHGCKRAPDEIQATLAKKAKGILEKYGDGGRPTRALVSAAFRAFDVPLEDVKALLKSIGE